MTTPVLDMNNEAVGLLADDEYGKAAKLLCEAFKSLKSQLIACRLPILQSSGSNDQAAPQNFLLPGIEILEARQYSNEDEESQDQGAMYSSKNQEAGDDEPFSDRRKKGPPTNDFTTREGLASEMSERDNASGRKRSRVQQDVACERNQAMSRPKRRRTIQSTTPPLALVTKSTPATRFNSSTEQQQQLVRQTDLLGRPLWLEPSTHDSNVNSPKILSVYASSILYNYGYALHLLGASTPDLRKRKQIYRATTKVYCKAIKLATRYRSSSVLSGIQWMSCHNLQQLLVEQNGACWNDSGTNHPDDVLLKHDILESRKIAILRSLNANNGAATSPADQMCLLVLSMLGIERIESSYRPAASA